MDGAVADGLVGCGSDRDEEKMAALVDVKVKAGAGPCTVTVSRSWRRRDGYSDPTLKVRNRKSQVRCYF